MSMIFIELANKFHLQPGTRDYLDCQAFFYAGHQAGKEAERIYQEGRQQRFPQVVRPGGECLNVIVNRGDSVRPRSCPKCGLSKDCPDGVQRNGN